MKATEQNLTAKVEQYFPLALFGMFSKVAQTFEPVDEILKCDYSNENY